MTLVGRYSDDLKTCFIERTILPLKFKSSKSEFERGNKGIFKKLTNYYSHSPELIYIGEWHTHPDSMPLPSNMDKQAMQKITENDKVNITSPLLMIIRISKEKYSIGLYVQFNKKLYKYEEEQSASN